MVADWMANGDVIPWALSASQIEEGTPRSAKVGDDMCSPARGSWGLPQKGF